MAAVAAERAGDAVGGTGLLDFALRAFVVTKAVQHHVGALGCQCLGDSQTDAAGRSGDQRGFSLEHVVSPCVSAGIIQVR